jgi:hypothetical protein
MTLTSAYRIARSIFRRTDNSTILKIERVGLGVKRD